MLDLDSFIADCHQSLNEPQPRLAAREILQRWLHRPSAVADRLRPERGGITLLHHSAELTVIDVVWAPGMKIYAHDHRMWAVIGVYTGREDNTFFRAASDTRCLVPSNGKTLDTGDIAVLGDNTIHAVANPLGELTGAIHVYGGDFVNEPRSQWPPPALTEEPYDAAAVARVFVDANAAWERARALTD